MLKAIGGFFTRDDSNKLRMHKFFKLWRTVAWLGGLAAAWLGLGCQTSSVTPVAPFPLFRKLSFEQAAQTASAENKAIFVFFDGEGAESRDELLTAVLPAKPIAELLRTRTIPIHLNVTEAPPELTKQYHVRDVPLLLLLASDGKELDRWTHVEGVEQFSHELSSSLAGESIVDRLLTSVNPTI